MPEKPRIAALYLRVSDVSQADRRRTGWDGEQETSLDTQQRHCRDHCAARGYTVSEAHVYVETFTGTVLWERPELTRLREAIRTHQFDVVVMLDSDRLGRDAVYQAIVLAEADHARVDVEFVAEPDFDKTPEAYLVRYIRSYAGQVERARLLDRVGRGRRARAQAGRLMHAWKPKFGYHWRDDSKSAYDVDPSTAPIVERIFREAVVERHAANNIAYRLTTDGIPTPLGKLASWRPNTIVSILRDPAYAGRAVAWRIGSAKSKTGKPINVINPESEWIALPDGTIPALVDQATWEKAQVLIDSNRKRRATFTEHPESHLLRGGLAKCGSCGGQMVPDWPSSELPNAYARRVYRCGVNKKHRDRCRGAYIRADILDAAVWDWVYERLDDAELLERELAHARTQDPTRHDIAVVERLLAQAERKVGNLAMAIANEDNADVQGALKTQLASMLQQQRGYQTERATVLERRGRWEQAQFVLDGIEAWVRQVKGQLGSGEMSYARKRQTLDAIETVVTVYRADEPVRWRIDTSIGGQLAGTVVATSCDTDNNAANTGIAEPIRLSYAHPGRLAPVG
jgi:site-specific DNA recombinase